MQSGSLVAYHRITRTRKQDTAREGERRGESRKGERERRRGQCTRVGGPGARSLEVIIITTSRVINVAICSVRA